MRRRTFVTMLAAGAALALAGTGTALAVTAPPPTTVTVGLTAGAALPGRYLGFSLPLNGLANPTITTGDLPQLMRTLGPGVMRWGGNVENDTFWTATNEVPQDWSQFT